MIDPMQFAERQGELTVEFAQYVVDHPEVDDLLPRESYIHFLIEGDAEFNRYSRRIAKQQRREDGAPVVWVRIKGLAPRQGSRLIDPVIEPASVVGRDAVTTAQRKKPLRRDTSLRRQRRLA